MGNGAAHRVATEGKAMGEWLAGLEEGGGKPVAGDDGSHGGVARCQAFGTGDHVGQIVEALAAEHVPEATECADHLIRYQ